MGDRSDSQMRITLSDERREAILESLVAFYAESFDETLSRFRAERILEFFVKTLGPHIYNQAVQDARAFMLEKLEDLDVEFYEPDEFT
jgi:uncharacterized protein (DUF2164 family)